VAPGPHNSDQVTLVLIVRKMKATEMTPVRKAALLTVGFRLLYSVVAAQFAPHLRLDEKLIHSNGLTADVMSRGAHPVLYALLGVWERFDTLWYIEIARHGYSNPAATVFYPLYPALIRVVSMLVRSELFAALLISTGAAFFLFLGAFRLFERDGKPPASFRAILLWAIWPAAFTFFAGYPDSLLCALIVWSFVLARSERWYAAAAAGFFAGLTKAMGCLVALPLLWMAWKQRRKEGVLAAGLSVAGIACFQGWMFINHYPSASQIYRTYWMTSTVAPWTTLIEAVRVAVQDHNFLLLLNLLMLAVVAAGALWPSVRAEYRIFAIAAICLFLTKHTEPLLQSTMRYCLTLFAAYYVFAAKPGFRFIVVLAAAAALNLLLFHSFLEWGLSV
jgi:hypothetical protein